MIDENTAQKLKRAARKERKCFEALCEDKDTPVTELATNYLKARKARKKLLDKVESA